MFIHHSSAMIRDMCSLLVIPTVGCFVVLVVFLNWFLCTEAPNLQNYQGKEDKKIPVSRTVTPSSPKADDHLHANCQDFPREATSAVCSQSCPFLHFIISTVSRHLSHSLGVRCLSLPIFKANS